jgi:hypothetical protein
MRITHLRPTFIGQQEMTALTATLSARIAQYRAHQCALLEAT